MKQSSFESKWLTQSKWLTRFCLMVLAAAWLQPSGLLLAIQTDAESPSLAYVQTHCFQCHGAESQKADRRFDLLKTDLADEETAAQWQEILDIVNLGEMPPEDQPQPTTAETNRFVAAVTQQLEKATQSLGANPQPVFRRLNRYEYRNTIRDLCGVNIDSFDPTTSFPADERIDGFENIGEHLVLSNYLLQCYLEAGSLSVQKASQENRSSESVNRVFTPDDLCQTKFYFRPHVMFEVNVDGSFVDVAHSDKGLKRVFARRFQGVPADGYYTLRIKAEGINREHPYAAKHLDVDRSEPIKMQVIVTDMRIKDAGRLQNTSDRIVATIPLADHQAKVYEVRTWMDRGFMPVVRYANGPAEFRKSLVRVARNYHADTLPSNWLDVFADQPAEQKPVWLSDAYQGPRLRIHKMELAGPEPKLQDAAPSATAADLLAQHAGTPLTLDRFLFRAFRRPPLESEIQRYRNFFESRLTLGESEKTALMTTLQAILCSPNFLYVEMPTAGERAPGQPQFQLATRLSYFLWSSMPDQELFDAAANHQLSNREQIVAQAIRMLNDPKATAFTEHFTDSWLHLNELGAMPPDSLKFPKFHTQELEPLMKEETRQFFAELLKKNLSIEHFLDSDFTFVNRYLANHYGIPNVVGDDFQRVSLPQGTFRGGLLGQASVLTMTSNGVETSPVTRGIWVLENILGTPPSPPPPDVNPLEPDIRGATTIREQLAKHRNVATCAECHRKIDPLGFALECFDPIGAQRLDYRDNQGAISQKVDTSGTLPTGESFENVAELKRLLLDQKAQFADCLTEKMLTYGLGRELGFRDRPHVMAMTHELAARGYGLRDLVELIVTSEPFRNE